MKTFKPSVRPSATEMLAAAAAADPLVPPAKITPSVPLSRHPEPADEAVQVNFRVRRRLADELADRAADERVSQRVLICRALQAAGFTVDPADLTDRKPRRRRGSI